MLTRRSVLPVLLIACLASWSACSTPPAPKQVKLQDQEALVGCGRCRFHVPGSTSCYWAIRIEEQYYPVRGKLPPNHNTHAPDGMCNMDRTALVSGTLRSGLFTATKFELRPAEAIPEQPEFSESDTEGH